MTSSEQFEITFNTAGEEMAVNDLTRQFSRRELFLRAMNLASYFREQGLKVDDHIAVLVGNRVEYVEILLASAIAGLWLTPVNWHLAKAEIEYVLKDSECRLLLLEPKFSTLLNDSLENEYRIIEINEKYENLVAPIGLQSINPDSPAGGLMMYTSGTTGRPKGVKRARAGDLQQTLSAWATTGNNIGLDGTGTHLVTGPMYHAAPLLYAIYDFLNGASILIMREWASEKALQLIEAYHVTHSHWVPTMFMRCLREKADFERDYDLSSLSLVLHGAAPIGRQLKHDIHHWWGDCLVEYWGGTESGIITRVGAEDWRNHIGTVGKPLKQFEVFAVDEDKKKLACGEIGTLYIRHRDLAEPFSYHGDSEKTESSYLAAGIFTLGDLGYIDIEGYVYLSDRRSNLIISGGVNIYPAEIEQVLIEHPAVEDVAVFGLKDKEWGQSVHAAVELNSQWQTADIEQELKVFAENSLARFKIPRSFQQVKKMPRYDSGKLYMSRLLKMLV